MEEKGSNQIALSHRQNEMGREYDMGALFKPCRVSICVFHAIFQFFCFRR